MTLEKRLTQCMEEAVQREEAAGLSLLIRKDDRELVYAQAGHADRKSGKPVSRDAIFRLYSQTKPVTAVAAMILAERGQLDLMEGVDRYLSGFRNPKVVQADGFAQALPRAPWILELMGMTAGLCYPDSDPAGTCAAQIFEQQQEDMKNGGGLDTVAFCNQLGKQPLAFAPGTHWRYSTCADVLGAVIEVASGRRFGEFLKEEIFEPLGMADTDFWTPPEKAERLVTCYERTSDGLREYEVCHLAVGKYDQPPAFESGGAGLVSTLDDYAAFGQMLLNGGTYRGHRILSPESVRYLRSPQLSPQVRRDLWDTLGGYNYGHLLRICDQPGASGYITSPGEYGWDGWLGTYFINLPRENITFLMYQNTKDTGTSGVTRRCRNILASALESSEI